MAFELKPLPFPKESLGPTMSTSTLEHHHEKHHAAYVKKLNELIRGTKFEKSDLESIIRATARGGAKEKTIFKGKPASKKIRATALKALKDLIQ